MLPLRERGRRVSKHANKLNNLGTGPYFVNSSDA